MEKEYDSTKRQPFGMRPQEVAAPPQSLNSVRCEETRTDFDLSTPAIDVINSAQLELTGGKN